MSGTSNEKNRKDNSHHSSSSSSSSSSTSSWWYNCIEAGAIGGIGAVPGTLMAHPYDVIKVRQQVKYESLRPAILSIYYNSNKNRNKNGTIHNFFNGSIPAIKQKVITRTPMFLVSAASVSVFETKLGYDRTTSAFLGSACSGYITGCLASPWEWQKVLRSQKIPSRATHKGIYRGILLESIQTHGMREGMRGILQRVHGAGIRNAIFDSTFFGTKRIVEDRLSLYQQQNPVSYNLGATTNSIAIGFAYGVAAITAVIVDFSVDVYVKRLYAIGPEIPLLSSSSVPSPTAMTAATTSISNHHMGKSGVGVIREVLRMIRGEGVVSVYRGLSIKCVEFSVSYLITGLCATYISWTVHQVITKIRRKTGQL